MTEELYAFDAEYRARAGVVCGVDEAGRGPLCGPVCVAAVILDPAAPVDGVNDSKKLSEKKREALYEEILARTVAYGIGIATVEEIERENILGATRLAFARAVEQLPPPFTLYTDYITGLNIPVPYTPIIKGDAKVYSIAAASILAKVMRDRMMRAYAEEYPEYGFDKHKGYGTAAHTEAILRYGPCPLHRRSFLKKLYADT